MKSLSFDMNLSKDECNRESNKSNHFNLYPNPATGKITIEPFESGSNMKGTVSVYGMSGKVFIKQKVQGSKAEINVSSLPKGIYFVRLINNEKIDFGKFIKD